jgi:hypothetical protein
MIGEYFSTMAHGDRPEPPSAGNGLIFPVPFRP